MTDSFAATQRTWIVDSLTRGDDGQRQVWQHLVSVYHEPLTVYCRALGLGEEAGTVVSELLASRMLQGDYLERWQQSGKLLRHWLCGGIWILLRERRRSPQRPRTEGLSIEIEAQDPGPLEALEQSMKASLARASLARAREVCIEKGLATHWSVFERRRLGTESYARICEDLGVDVDRGPGMTRTVSKHVRQALKDLLLRDGVALERVQSVLEEF